MNTKIIEVTMRDETIAKVDELKQKMHAPSRSDAIRRAVELSETLTRALEKGDKIIIQGKEGNKQVTIPGVQIVDKNLQNT